MSRPRLYPYQYISSLIYNNDMPPSSSGLPVRKSIRLPGFDYTQPGGYFVTINTYKRAKLFGQLISGQVQLSPLGEIVKVEWEKLRYRFPGVELDFYRIMPEHFHAALLNHVYSELDGETHEQFGRPVRASLPTIIRSFKASVTVRAQHLLEVKGPIWQRNYYEEVIEDEAALDRVRAYILGNPYK
jgi:putative transposase